jgi:hypothetical protein
MHSRAYNKNLFAQPITVLATTTAASRLDCSDVDLFHLHHRLERALDYCGVWPHDHFHQSQPLS